jgi:hypothetical protein
LRLGCGWLFRLPKKPSRDRERGPGPGA